MQGPGEDTPQCMDHTHDVERRTRTLAHTEGSEDIDTEVEKQWFLVPQAVLHGWPRWSPSPCLRPSV